MTTEKTGKRGSASHEGRDVFVENLVFTMNTEVGAELDQICLLQYSGLAKLDLRRQGYQPGTYRNSLNDKWPRPGLGWVRA